MVGSCKGFNNRAGFDCYYVKGDKKDEDVFTHHSGITVDTEQYKYLVQGEYVTFGVAQVIIMNIQSTGNVKGY